MIRLRDFLQESRNIIYDIHMEIGGSCWYSSHYKSTLSFNQQFVILRKKSVTNVRDINTYDKNASESWHETLKFCESIELT